MRAGRSLEQDLRASQGDGAPPSLVSPHCTQTHSLFLPSLRLSIPCTRRLSRWIVHTSACPAVPPMGREHGCPHTHLSLCSWHVTSASCLFDDLMLIIKRTNVFISGLRIIFEFHGKKNILGGFSGLFSGSNNPEHGDLKLKSST